jgi:hypothetical protein
LAASIAAQNWSVGQEIEVMAAPDPRLTLVQDGEGANAFELQCSTPFAPPTTHRVRDEQSALGRSTWPKRSVDQFARSVAEDVVRTSPPVSEARHDESARQLTACTDAVQSTGALCQAFQTLLAGATENTTLPAPSAPAQYAVVGQLSATTGEVQIPIFVDTHDPDPPVGLVLTRPLWSSAIATHSVLLGHDTTTGSTSGEPAATWTCQTGEFANGLVEVRTSPWPVPAAQKFAVGHERPEIQSPAPMAVAVHSGVGSAGFVELNTCPSSVPTMQDSPTVQSITVGNVPAGRADDAHVPDVGLDVDRMFPPSSTA